MALLSKLIGGLRGMLGKPQATPETDPQLWLNGLLAMPDPDPILRSIGQAERVYNGMVREPHILGEIRSLRGNFRSYKYRLLPGNEGDAASLRAHQICEEWMRSTAPCGMDSNGVQTDWMEVMWQMASSVLYGYRAHEVVPDLVNGLYLPTAVVDRPNRRFTFKADGSPLLISKGSGLQGEPVDPWRYVISRHMADATNPYGIAILSACFWAWTFKTGGWKYFVKYCEKHGLPWPVARYPMGTPDADIDKLEKAISEMVESGYVVTQEGTGLELLVPNSSGSGSLPQLQLIQLANAEISKAINGQAMVSELNGVGARAASETAADRQAAINDSDRDTAAAGMGQIFKWITRWNIGDGVSPPTLEFFRNEKAGKDRAETYQIAVAMGANPSKSALLEELGIPEAEDEADRLTAPKPAAPALPAQPAKPAPKQGEPTPPTELELSGLAGLTFAKAAGMTEEEAITLATEAADQAIETSMIAPVAQMLADYEAQGKTLAEFKAALEDVVGVMDDEALREVIERALQYSILRGSATKAA
jgi:phage gp29-like protein